MRKYLALGLIAVATLLSGCSVTLGVRPEPGYYRYPHQAPVYRPVYHPHCGCWR